MGYTHFEIELISRHLEGVTSVLDLGSQNLYLNGEKDPPFASTFYEKKHIPYTCIDLAGDNNAVKLNLSHPITSSRKYSLVCDCGTSEHIVLTDGYEEVAYHNGYIKSVYPKNITGILEGYYNCWLNKHSFLKVGGVMVSVNPMTGMWEGHGYTYLTEDFYTSLCAITDYEILELGENCAMSNCETGKNIYCVMRKHSNTFPVFKEFKKLPIQKS